MGMIQLSDVIEAWDDKTALLIAADSFSERGMFAVEHALRWAVRTGATPYLTNADSCSHRWVWFCPTSSDSSWFQQRERLRVGSPKTCHLHPELMPFGCGRHHTASYAERSDAILAVLNRYILLYQVLNGPDAI